MKHKKEVSWMLGGAVFLNGILMARPGTALFIMIMIIAGIIAHYNKKRIKRIIEKIRKKR
ncbi:hypothetical protein KY366_03505 [Candidatus Woesearchaeota archaeon]|nr:hypothetical protein [Candidatus Woesearchaeota archaeon]